MSLPLLASTLAADELEYKVKAAFLLNFGKYTQWPAPVLATMTEGLNCCIFGPDPFKTILEETLRDKVIHSAKVVIIRPPRSNALPACHIVFISGDETAAALKTLQGKPVLTVGDDDEFLKLGGMVRFVRIENRLAFEINLPAVEEAGLQLSSHLLRLARNLGKGTP